MNLPCQDPPTVEVVATLFYPLVWLNFAPAYSIRLFAYLHLLQLLRCTYLSRIRVSGLQTTLHEPLNTYIICFHPTSLTYSYTQMNMCMFQHSASQMWRSRAYITFRFQTLCSCCENLTTRICLFSYPDLYTTSIHLLRKGLALPRAV